MFFSNLFATPIVGFLRTTPICEANPYPLGWAFPCPSTIRTSNVSPFVAISIGLVSLRKKKVGIYGKDTVVSITLVFRTSPSGNVVITNAALAFSSLYETSTAATFLTSFIFLSTILLLSFF
ncbi:121aa long hypothetical protein [Pyrococcus horikoshii OT3]|uniref:Uncharacterized protein n=1 Tax=Pyrococcus horikoshii (strain ATCC 700860 / DSM 12428 / JCM 9974 / NBRC 100139 / OT-3) TaxID=70601 RepID=O58395_PYRHO|nr:121aa long hypothetical protein [Pyrococcus horikoshii OT3]